MKTMLNFEELCMQDLGHTPGGSWLEKPVILDAVAEKLQAAGANLWAFSSDARQFWQFAGDAEKAALASLTKEEHFALLGEWTEEDWYPETFGYQS